MRNQPHKKAEKFCMNKAKKVIKICGRCKGAGYVITGGHQILCADCDGHGHTLVDREKYYRELRREVRDARYRK